MLRGDRWRCRDGHFTVVFVLASVCSDRNWRLRQWRDGARPRHHPTRQGHLVAQSLVPLGIHESRAHLGRMAEAGDPAEEFSYLLADQTVDARSPSLLEVERLRLFDIRIASSHIALLLFGDAAVVIGISIVGIEPDRFG